MDHPSNIVHNVPCFSLSFIAICKDPFFERSPWLIRVETGRTQVSWNHVWPLKCASVEFASHIDDSNAVWVVLYFSRKVCRLTPVRLSSRKWSVKSKRGNLHVIATVWATGNFARTCGTYSILGTSLKCKLNSMFRVTSCRERHTQSACRSRSLVYLALEDDRIVVLVTEMYRKKYCRWTYSDGSYVEINRAREVSYLQYFLFAYCKIATHRWTVLWAVTLRFTTERWMVKCTQTGIELRDLQYKQNLTAYVTASCAVRYAVPLLVATKQGRLPVDINSARTFPGSSLTSLSMLLSSIDTLLAYSTIYSCTLSSGYHRRKY